MARFLVFQTTLEIPLSFTVVDVDTALTSPAQQTRARMYHCSIFSRVYVHVLSNCDPSVGAFRTLSGPTYELALSPRCPTPYSFATLVHSSSIDINYQHRLNSVLGIITRQYHTFLKQATIYAAAATR